MHRSGRVTMMIVLAMVLVMVSGSLALGQIVPNQLEPSDDGPPVITTVAPGVPLIPTNPPVPTLAPRVTPTPPRFRCGKRQPRSRRAHRG